MTRHVKKSATPSQELAPAAEERPKLTSAEIDRLTSGFNVKLWDATADADRAAEDAMRARKKRVASA